MDPGLRRGDLVGVGALWAATYSISSLRKQGSTSQPAWEETWIPAFAGMTTEFVGSVMVKSEEPGRAFTRPVWLTASTTRR
jgi:hypothetical protein